MSNGVHPLLQAYHDVIKKRYGRGLWGDRKPERTEIIAGKVNRLGIGYDTFAKLAVLLWEEWAQKQGHPYPYWNIISSDKTFERLTDYIVMTSDVDVVQQEVDSSDFTSELEFALDYIRWVRGHILHRPFKRFNVSTKVKVAVAEYICRLYGVPCTSSNYNLIAESIAQW